MPHANPLSKKIEGFVYNLILFTKDHAQKNSYILCTSNKIFSSSLKNFLLNKPGPKNIEVKESFSSCDYIYVDDKLSANDRKVIEKSFRGKSVLLINNGLVNTDIGMINIKVLDSKIRFSANVSMMKEQNVNVSSKVLRLAEQVY